MFQQASVLEQIAQNPGWSASMAGLIVATASGCIGLLAGFAGAYLKVKGENFATKEDFRNALRRIEENTRTVEKVKAAVSTEVTLNSELREAVRHFTAAAGALIHSMCWLTWDCTARRRINARMVRQYDKEIHRLCPDIVSQLAVIAMLDVRVHDRLSVLATDMFRLDAEVGNAIVTGETDLEPGLALLRKHHDAAITLEREFRAKVVDMFGGEETSPERTLAAKTAS